MWKVAIVGGAPSSRMLAPFDDPEWEIWCLGNQLEAYKDKGVDRVFEIHDDLSHYEAGYMDWLVDNSTALVVGESSPLIGEDVEVYPFDEVNALMGGQHLSSTISYMMGYALMKGVTHIGLYGVDMAVNDKEYFKQRPDVYAWIGYAKAKGVEVIIPKEAAIFTSEYCYGRDLGAGLDNGLGPFTQKGFAEMSSKHEKRIKEIEVEIHRLERERDTRDGCIQAYDLMGRAVRAIDSGAVVTSLSDITLPT